jgi:hypothetical protein
VTLNGRAYPFFEVGAAKNLPPGSFPTGAFNRLGSGSFEMATVERNPHRNYVMEWNVNVQRELTPNLTALVGYVGSRGIHQAYRADESDIVIPIATSAGYLWPNPIGSGTPINPNAGTIRPLFWGGTSLYDALQVGIQKKMSHGLQIQGSYTWAKSIDNNSGVLAGDTFSNTISSSDWFDWRLTRGLADFDVRPTLVINGTWILPALKSAPAAVGWAANGWQFSSVFKANDGVPFSPLFGAGGGDPRGTLSSDDFGYPNRLTGCNAVNLNFKKSPSGVPLYVNPNCFALPMAPSMAFWTANCDSTTPIYGPNSTPEPFPVCFNLRGNAGRNTLIGPGLQNLDFSIVKNNYIKRVSENFNVQLRAEFFNILNRANFNVPDLGSLYDNIFDGSGTVSSTAGLLTHLTTDPREIQFALKFVW